MANTKGYQRKNYFIKKKFQGRYMFGFYFLLASLLLLFTILLCYNTAGHLTITYENDALQVASTPTILFKHILIAGWLIMIPLGFLFSWLIMRHTHRIAGPLYKFEVVLNQMSRGVLEPNVRLRKTDDGQEVAAWMQDANRFLADKVIELRSLTGKLRDAPQVGKSPELQKLVTDLQQALAVFQIKE